MDYTNLYLQAKRRRYQNVRFFESLNRWAIVGDILAFCIAIICVVGHFAIKYW
jgi:hypothetical protein